MSKNVQFIGFGINTGPKKDIVSGKQIYLGLDDSKQDYEARVELLQKAAEVAAKKADKSAIKIFTVPEFYFRGKNGAYDMSTIMGDGEVDKGLIGKLQETFMDAKWKNWTFVIGSIIGYSAKAKEKDVTIGDIIIPVFKHKGQANTDVVRKPVNREDLTVEEALRLAVLTKDFKEAFAKDRNIKDKPDFDDLVLDAAKKWFEKQVDTIADSKVKDATKKEGAKVYSKLEKIDKDLELEQLRNDYPLDWKATEDTSAKEVYNIVPIILGGFGTEAKAGDNTRVVMKEFKSGIDFIKKADVDQGYYSASLADVLADINRGNDGAVNHLDGWGLIKIDGNLNIAKIEEIKKSKSSDWGKVTIKRKFWFDGTRSTKAYQMDPLGIFKLGDLTFAVDICLDHAYKVSKKMINALNHNDMKPIINKVISEEEAKVIKQVIKGVDIQIIPSCGMTIKKDSVSAKENGYVFNCDGLNGSIGDGYKSIVTNNSTCFGYAHTGLMRVKKLDMANNGTLTDLEPFNKLKATTVSQFDTGVTTVKGIAINELYWDRAGVTSNNRLLDGPEGGAVHIYSVVSI